MVSMDQRPLLPGCRVRIDNGRARASFPKDAWCGQLSMEGVRLSRTLEAIVDATAFRPWVTEVRAEEVEVATSYFGEGLLTLRIPRAAVLAVTEASPEDAWAT